MQVSTTRRPLKVPIFVLTVSHLRYSILFLKRNLHRFSSVTTFDLYTVVGAFYWIMSYFIVIIFIASIRSNRINKSKLIFWLFYLIRAVFILSSTHLWYLLSIARLLRYALFGRLSKIVIHFE